MGKTLPPSRRVQKTRSKQQEEAEGVIYTPNRALFHALCTNPHQKAIQPLSSYGGWGKTKKGYKGAASDGNGSDSPPSAHHVYSRKALDDTDKHIFIWNIL